MCQNKIWIYLAIYFAYWTNWRKMQVFTSTVDVLREWERWDDEKELKILNFKSVGKQIYWTMLKSWKDYILHILRQKHKRHLWCTGHVVIGLIMVYISKGLFPTRSWHRGQLGRKNPCACCALQNRAQRHCGSGVIYCPANFATISRNYWEGRDNVVIRHIPKMYWQLLPKLNSMNQQILMSREDLW